MGYRLGLGLCPPSSERTRAVVVPLGLPQPSQPGSCLVSLPCPQAGPRRPHLFLSWARGQCDQHPVFRDLRDQDGPPQPLRHPPVVPLPVTPRHPPGGHQAGTAGSCAAGRLSTPGLQPCPDPALPFQPDVHPGNCWAFQGPQGFAVIRLSARIRPTAVTLEHVPKSLSPNSTISSAPKDFAVFVSVPVRPEEGCGRAWGLC